MNMIKSRPTIHVLHNVAMNDFMKHIAIERRNVLSTEPFAVTNISRILDRIDNWGKWFGFIKPYFAIKSQHNVVTNRLFHKMGVGYECASEFEIESVLSTSCSREEIVVAHPIKNYYCLAEIVRHGMLSVVDSAEETDKLMWVYETMKNRSEKYELLKPLSSSDAENKIESIRIPQVLLRITPSKKEHSKVGWDLSGKFGVEKHEFRDLVRHCKASKIDIQGISFHVGCRAPDALPWINTLSDARWCWDILLEYGFNPTILDIGGGYKGHDRSGLLAEIGYTIQNAVKELFETVEKFPDVIAEPGTFMIGESQSIAACVVGTKKNSTSQPDYYLSAGVYNGLIWHLLDPGYPTDLTVLHTEKTDQNAVLEVAHLWGVSADSADDLGYAALPKLNMGDWLMYPAVGDYYLELCTQSFNGFRPPEMFYCCEHRHLESIKCIFQESFNFKRITNMYDQFN